MADLGLVLDLVLVLVFARHGGVGDAAADDRAVGELDCQHAVDEGLDAPGVLAAVGDAVAVGVALARVVAGLDLHAVLEAVAVAVGLPRVRAAGVLAAVVEPVVVLVLLGLVGLQRQVMSVLPGVGEAVMISIRAGRESD